MSAPNVERVAKQIGGTLLPDNPQWHNRFEIKSKSSGKLYVIAQRRSDDVWGCGCAGWRHYRKCKHLTDVLERLSKVSAVGYDPVTILMLASARAALDIEPPRTVATPKAQGRRVDI